MCELGVLAYLNEPGNWEPDWLWGLLLILFTVVLHVIGLEVARQGIFHAIGNHAVHFHPRTAFITIVGCMTLSATVLHGIETIVWACAYRLLNALQNRHEAILYSLNAITSYGHASLQLEPRWELMGALEALNGWLLFGLSTAFLFAVIGRLASVDMRLRDLMPAIVRRADSTHETPGT